jgi:hypothetical protein
MGLSLPDDSWQDDPSQAALQAANRPSDPAGSAGYESLPTGSYTAIVFSKGVRQRRLDEVYNLQ